MVRTKPDLEAQPRQPEGRSQVAAPGQHLLQPPNPAHGTSVRIAPPPRGAAAMQIVQSRYQDPGARQIPRAQFRREAYKILKEFKVIYEDGGYRFQSKAIDTLQEAAEAYVTLLFQDAQLCAKHGRRKTIMLKDLKLADRLATIGVVKLGEVVSRDL